jgi:hypothetical protein
MYLSVHLSICLSAYLSVYLYSPRELWPLFQVFLLYTVGRTPWTEDQLVTRPLPTHTTTQTLNKRTHISMPLVRFEPTFPVSEQAKTVHALDRAAAVIVSCDL